MSVSTDNQLIHYPAFLSGIALMLAGYGLYEFFSPSPHGFLELFFAMPVFCLGLAFLGVSFVVHPASRFRSARWAVAGLLLLVSASPILYLAWLFVR